MTDQSLGDLAEKQTQERFEAWGHEVRRTPGSGNKSGHKGDLVLPGVYLIENKATGAGRLSVVRSWLNKIVAEAAEKGLKPLLTIQYYNTSEGKDCDPYVVLPEKDFLQLLDQANKGTDAAQ